MHTPHSTPNFDDPVEWLTRPEYYHAPLRIGVHTIPIAARMSIVTFAVEAGHNGQTVVITVHSADA